MWLQRKHEKSLSTICGQKIYAKKRISFNETFCTISWKDSFRIIVTLVHTTFRIASDGCWWNIFQWRFVRENVYTWHNQMVFLLWKEKNIRIPSDEIRIVVSKVLWEQRKFWVLCKGQGAKLQICRVQRREISFPTKFKEGYFDLYVLIRIISVKSHSL